ncbi:hypothetical protein [Guptibacillus hwajinpoensis]|uniref:hypothetical protein n=1 Tax=Guptibacillus hwajinpoensis TaxID=208199 RepID=UPI00273FCC12|nr:hypothetical protein [Pseudalkalibacillus hwajinpoensis]WLR60659.1 hypothetical protein LC071_04710 [Pseudalkalibacillus hwajinpoensis]
MSRRRVTGVGFLFMCLMFVLVGRLIQLQLVETESYSKHEVNLIEASIDQRTQSYVLDEGRGTMLDRNGIPMSETIPALVLFPFLKDRDWPIEEVAKIIKTSPDEIDRSFDKRKQPFNYEKKTNI